MNKMYRWIWKYNNDTIKESMLASNKDYFINLSDNENFVKDYWDIIIEYTIKWNINLDDIDISNRKDNIYEYDNDLKLNKKDWIKIEINNFINHYRINKNKLKVSKLLFVSNDYKKNVSNIIKFTRELYWLKQSEFADKLWINRIKISEYENMKREIEPERFFKITNFLKYKKNIKFWNETIEFL